MTGKRNPWAWLAPLIAFAAVVSYFLVFAEVATLRDFPWINLPLVWGAIVLAVLGLHRARASGHGKFVAVAGLLATLVLAALFHAYVFWLSYQLPAATTAAAVSTPAPGFTLTDQTGASVSLSDYPGRNVLIVFYRGHW